VRLFITDDINAVKKRPCLRVSAEGTVFWGVHDNVYTRLSLAFGGASELEWSIQDLGGEMDIENEEYFFDLRSRLLDLMAKFKSVCSMHSRNFKVEIDELFNEADKG